jgi:hypothetical protein
MLQNITHKKPSSLLITWLFIIASLFATSILLYLYLLNFYRSAGSLLASENGIFTRIVFWSLMGALSHLLIVGLQRVKKKQEIFYLHDVLLQALQILVAPLIAILLFSILYSNVQNVPFDNGYIVLSFVCGLLTIQLFLSLKQKQEGQNELHDFALPPAEYITAGTPQTEKVEQEWQEENYGFTATSDLFITLELNTLGLFEDVKKELRQKGFAATSVSLQKEGQEDIMNAKKTADELFPVYYLENLDQDTYTIRAMLSVRMKDNSIVNLFGEKKVLLSGDDIDIKLLLQKLKV